MTPPARTAAAPPSRRRPAARVLVILAVCGGIGVGLRLLDAVPPWWLGQPRTPIAYPSVHDLERAQRTRLLLPFFFPDSVVWPPASVVLAPGAGRPVLLQFDWADGRGLALQVAQLLDGDGTIPGRLVPPSPVRRLPEGQAQGEPTILQGVGVDGRAFLEFSDVVDGRRVVLRWFDADPSPLRRMAHSLRRR